MRALVLLLCLVALPAAAFDLQGHRGFRGAQPENTLPAFAAALSLGVSTLELDLALTADDVLVVAHDPVLLPKLVRGPDGQYLTAPGPSLRSLTYAQIQAYDVGRLNRADRTVSQFPNQAAVDGTRIPRLMDVFALVARSGNQNVRFNIEIKMDPRQPDLTAPPEHFAARVVDAVRSAGLTGRTTVQGFDWRPLQAVRRLAPEITTACLSVRQRWLDNVAPGSAWTAGFDLAAHGHSVPHLVRAAGCGIWSPAFPDVDAAQVQAARSIGLPVIPWTVNDPLDMARLIDLGVDGLITDFPDVARTVLQAKGLPLPRPTPVAP